MSKKFHFGGHFVLLSRR